MSKVVTTSAAMSEVLSPEEKAFREAEVVLEQMARVSEPGPRATTASLLEFDLADGRQAPLNLIEAKCRALVEQIPVITFMAPLDGTVSELYVSPQIEAILGFSSTEWLNNPILWYDQLHPEDQERWQAEFARTLSAGEHFRSDY